MIVNLQFGRYQAVIKINRKRGRSKKTLFQELQEYFFRLKRIFSDRRFTGHPISRVFRFVFENKKIRQILGINLMAVTVLSGVISPSISAFNSLKEDEEITKISAQIIQLTTTNSVHFPVQSVRITQGYHRFHQGIDFAEPLGSPIYPIMEGKVEAVYWGRFGYGNHLIIDHGLGFKSLYAHLSKIIVKKGEEVDKNTVIGLVGATGWATGPHLHLETWDNGQPFNPLTILK